MAPQLPPPVLPDDAVAEILIRLPPDEPRCLCRASLVCKLWKRLLTDTAFLRRYRRFHRTPPLLGYFFVGDVRGKTIPEFVTTVVASPFPPADVRLSPLGGPRLPPWARAPSEDAGRQLHRLGPNHWCPEGAPRAPRFIRVLLRCGALRRRRMRPPRLPWRPLPRRLGVYSSQVGSWGWPVSVCLGADDFLKTNRRTLVGNCLYFMTKMGATILKYDLAKHHLSVIEPPESYDNGIFIVPTEDDLLGVAGARGSTLHLWSRKANAEGVEGWIQYRVIKLGTLLPVDDRFKTATVAAFAEGVRVIFVCTEIGHFVIDLSSEQARRVSKPGVQYHIVPFTSFYTPDCARVNFPLLAETN